MDGFMAVVVLCLLILVCALIHEVCKLKSDVADLEYEVTNQKLEYRGDIKRLNGKLNFIKACREEGEIDEFV